MQVLKEKTYFRSIFALYPANISFLSGGTKPLKDRVHLFGLSPLPKNLEEALSVQKELLSKVILRDSFNQINIIAGVDVSYKNSIAKASVVLFLYKNLELLEFATASSFVEFPYIPGFLSFREIPPLLEAIKKLKNFPDVILCDGQGIAHPRGMGIATHLGIVLDVPTIGVAKSRLIGTYKEPDNEKGKWTPLRYKGKVVGAVLRTKRGVKPVFVSPGHRISLKSAINIVMHTVTKYKIPEPLRIAHQLSSDSARFL